MDKTTIKCLLALLLLATLASCASESISSDDSEAIDGESYKGLYEGTWAVDGTQAGNADVTVYDSGFGFKELPTDAIMRKLLPKAGVTAARNGGNIVPGHIIGISDYAVYYDVTPSRWEMEGSKGSRACRIVMRFSGLDNDYSSSSDAIYSRLSGTYNISISLTSVTVYDMTTKKMIASSGPTRTRLTFVTTRKKS